MGTALHEIFEHTDFTNFENEIDYTIRRCFSNNGIKEKDEWINATKEIVYDVVNAKLPIIQGSNIKEETFKLNTISLDNRNDETEFNFNVFGDALKDYCNGFVDLIFRQGDYYSILDWKSDSLNDDFESYASLQSLKKHVDDCYSIQRVLYSYCLIKWLHQFMPNMSLEDIYNNHFGGVYYVFLRGCHEDSSNGIYCQTWNSWKDLEDSFKEIISKKIGGVVNV